MGAEKLVMPVTASELVDHRVPTTTTYVALPGLAMALPLAGPGAAGAPPYGVLVRDAVADDVFVIVSSEVPPSRRLARYVIGRVTARPQGAAAAAVFAARGVSVEGLDPAGVLLEVEPPADETIRNVTSVADLTDLDEGTVVRIPLFFRSEAVPTCRLDSDGCPPRAVAGGAGPFVHLAQGIADGQPILVQTRYPASVVPGRWLGTQQRNGPQLRAFVATLPVRALAGWGRTTLILSVAEVPGLERDRLWLGPVLLAIAAGTLWLGGRIGYPYFRPSAEGRRGWRSRHPQRAPETTAWGPVRVRISGRAATVDGERRHFDEAPGHLRAGPTAAVWLDDGGMVDLSATDTGWLGTTERGEVVTVRDVRPALLVHRYGTDLRLTFDSVADRDAAAGMVGRAGAP